MRVTSFLLQELSANATQSKSVDTFFNRLLFVDFVLLIIAIYFTPPYDYNLFLLSSIIGLTGLLVWCQLKYNALNPLPNSLTIGPLVFILFIAISAVTSHNQKLALMYLIQLRLLVLGRLLYNAPFQERSRKYIIVIFFLAASAAGFAGAMQYFGLMHRAEITGGRVYGFSEHPITYACIMAVACVAAITMLFIPKTNIFNSKIGFYFLLIVVLSTFCGVLLSKTRGVWLALFTAPLITIFLYKRKKAVFFLFFLIALFLAVSVINKHDFMKRVSSIVTSMYQKADDPDGSTETRFELWKGALLIFQKHPLVGCGLGDYQSSIDALIAENKLNKHTGFTLHAHNIYLQALATCGILGFVLMMMLFLSLITWGIKRIRLDEGRGAYFIILYTVFYMVVGLTYSPHGDTMFMGACCVMAGLLGPYGSNNPDSFGGGSGHRL